jgi:SAM-dependent methyltransferase
MPNTDILQRDDFDEASYLDANPDVAAAVKAGKIRSGWHHFASCGYAEGRQPGKKPSSEGTPTPDLEAARRSRAAHIMRFIPSQECHGIEIGAWFAPLAPKSEGWNVLVLDVFDTDELRKIAQTSPGVPPGAVARIEPVDLVGHAHQIADLAEAAGIRAGSLDFVLSSHNFEHLPDPIRFLQGVERVLRPGGILSMALPDRRTSFDHLRPPSTLGQMLEAWLDQRTKPTPRQIFDHQRGTSARRLSDGTLRVDFPLEGWVGEIETPDNLAHEWTRFRASHGQEDEAYEDAHCWLFTPAELELHLCDLRELGILQLQTLACDATAGVEFFVHLQMPGDLSQPERTRAEIFRALLAERAGDTRGISSLRNQVSTFQQVLAAAQDKMAQYKAKVGQVLSSRPRRLTAPVDPPASPAMPAVDNPLLRFEQRAPSDQTAVDLFRGRWACNLEPLIGVSGTGEALLFTHDRRPEQAAAAIGHEGGFSGFNVLELGPLEAAHTYLLETLGAASITAVEANAEAYLKCLVVKEVLGLTRSRFLFGDIVEYLSATSTPYDLVFCSGVLYHMADPLTPIRLICNLTDRCFVWTHYYDADRHPVPFAAQPHSVQGFSANYWSHTYGDRSSNFWGGNKQTATWLERDTLLAAFRHFGLSDITVILDDPNHPNGPAITFAARRK